MQRQVRFPDSTVSMHADEVFVVFGWLKAESTTPTLPMV